MDESSDPCLGLVLGPPVPIVGGESLPEISGAVLGSDHRDGLSVWVHQDSGHPAQLFRVGLDGTIADTVAIDNISPVDWEDVAAANDDQGRRHLFVADIGDNRRVRPHVEVHRLIEPAFGARGATADVLELVLPHGARDAEALIIDTETDTIVILTKSVTGTTEVLAAGSAAWVPHGTRLDLDPVGTIDLGVGQAVLAADISPDRSLLGVRTPSRVLLWALEPGRSVTESLLGESPCGAPAPFDIFGEALALTNQGYVLLGESAAPALRMVESGKD